MGTVIDVSDTAGSEHRTPEHRTPETGASETGASADRPGDRSDGRATRWSDHKVRRREHILAAAVEVISESGSDVGVQRIAERAGIPRSVVYRHFQGRGDLDEQIRERIIDLLLEAISPALTPHGTVRGAIDHAVTAYMQWIIDVPRLHQFLGIGSASRRTVGSRVVTGTKTAIAVQLSEIFGRVLTAANASPAVAETLAFALTGMVDSSVNRWLARDGSSMTADELGDFLRTAIWQVIDGTLRGVGVTIGPDTPITELTGRT